MEGAKNAYRAFQEVRRADTLARAFRSPGTALAPCKAHLHGTGSHWLVGGRRPSVLQRWGSGVLPRRFPVALKALPEPWRLDRSGDRGAKHARDFEAAKEQCRIDNHGQNVNT